MEDREVVATLALSLVPGIGSQRLRTLISTFGSAQAALDAPQSKLAAVFGVGRAAATAIKEARPDDGARVVSQLCAMGARALICGEPEFPPQLEEIPDPPAVLFAWGDPSLLARPCVAFVGSRDHTTYGAEAARILAGAVAQRAVVVSGMARGIDGIAHGAALDAGGTSIGVLGNGFGVIYPASNRELYERMIRQGCLITELPPGERPHAGAFPRRNRLISGLAGVTVVVEAAAASGALITADCALEQGRAVLAVPGPITSPTSLGCNKLIQQGAKPALSAADILEELGISPSAAPGAPRQSPAHLSGLQQALWRALEPEAKHVDALVASVEASGARTADVLTALTELELRGLVRQEPGMVFRTS